MTAGTVILGCTRIREESRFNSAILADLAVRGLAISFVTLVSIAFPDSFLVFLCSMDPFWHRRGSRSVPFSTVTNDSARFLSEERTAHRRRWSPP